MVIFLHFSVLWVAIYSVRWIRSTIPARNCVLCSYEILSKSWFNNWLQLPSCTRLIKSDSLKWLEHSQNRRGSSYSLFMHFRSRFQAIAWIPDHGVQFLNGIMPEYKIKCPSWLEYQTFDHQTCLTHSKTGLEYSGYPKNRHFVVCCCKLNNTCYISEREVIPSYHMYRL